MNAYYSDDSVTIYLGNCLDLPLPKIVGEVIVTDPPYGIGWTRSLNKKRGSKASEGIQNDTDTSVRDTMLWQHSDSPAVVFGSFYAPFPKDVRQVLVWQKPPDAGVVGSVTGYRRDAEPVFLVGPWPILPVRWSSVLRSGARSSGNPSGPAGQTGHPHTKPVDLMRDLIEHAPLGVVLDPFMGTGTTLVAAKQLGRKAIGIEIEERWCEVAARRLSQETLGLSA